MISTKSSVKDKDTIVGDIVYKVPIAGIKEVNLKANKKTKNIEFVVVMDEDKQNKILAEFMMKPIKKEKHNFEIETHEIARMFLAVMNRNYILATNVPLVVNDNVSPKDL